MPVWIGPPVEVKRPGMVFCGESITTNDVYLGEEKIEEEVETEKIFSPPTYLTSDVEPTIYPPVEIKSTIKKAKKE